MSDERDLRGMMGGGKDATGAPSHGTPGSDHWLVRSSTIRRLWVVFVLILVLTVLPDFVIEQYEHFGIDGTFGFYAWYGFASSAGLIIVAKLLAAFVKREDSYYGD